ncbi:MAG: CPXCG motif-containing cysteine-rich protein [Bacteroidia bacterium]|nr:CPXCG motif-containing cysteine-rich protein [Bacteroidia bacterium]MBT8268267.1 CPXCG motif-containing cysteine-rich protein [Bacteroidia bacterium]NNF82994.1 CPXCG motif-containing cysteine-rich protein [Flavobacteriaceae bacterium]NNK70312.1 CPXCG motif-containing cysteine-rich protein [Flavobacteriaceae bacterium]NNL81107.1 CPXCG motif-containing cysteine-rich protein [Flavobacteriaceae bacterium]
MQEVFFSCPYCWETISMLVDLSVPEQDYIEDCEVCCNPIQLLVLIAEDSIKSLEARLIGQ